MAPASRGRSLLNSWPCNVRVPVEMSTRRPESSAGTRYAKVLPVPVPASTTSGARFSSASATRPAIASCERRGVNPGSERASGPRGPKTSSSDCINELGVSPHPGGRGNLSRRAQAVETQILESVLVSLDADLEVRTLGRVAARREVVVAEAGEVVAHRDPHVLGERGADVESRRVVEHVRFPGVQHGGVYAEVESARELATQVRTENVGETRVLLAFERARHVAGTVLQPELHGRVELPVGVQVVHHARRLERRQQVTV